MLQNEQLIIEYNLLGNRKMQNRKATKHRKTRKLKIENWKIKSHTGSYKDTPSMETCQIFIFYILFTMFTK